MLAAIKEMSTYRDEVTKESHLETANYLDACNKLFENGILSHQIIDSWFPSVAEYEAGIWILQRLAPTTQ